MNATRKCENRQTSEIALLNFIKYCSIFVLLSESPEMAPSSKLLVLTFRIFPIASILVINLNNLRIGQFTAEHFLFSKDSILDSNTLSK